MRFLIVAKLVSMPPSQRLFTYGWPARAASSAMGSWACFFVPTNRTVSPRATVSRTNSSASSSRLTVCARSMMWIPLRSAKMNGRILGFQRRVWWPKWTPASSSWRIETVGMGSDLLFGWTSAGLVVRGPDGDLSTRHRGTVPSGPVARVSSVTAHRGVVRAISPLLRPAECSASLRAAPARSALERGPMMAQPRWAAGPTRRLDRDEVHAHGQRRQARPSGRTPTATNRATA